jgi:predicted enzyme related to lactoylglutathione lyase
MTVTIENICFDCADAYSLGQFWSQVLGLPLSDDDFPGDPAAVIALPHGQMLYFERVPEPKTVKNRMHLCLRPQTTRDGEFGRLLGLGATIVDDRRELAEDGGWVVLADPEGNEFCLLRSPAEKAAWLAARAAG